MSDLGVSVFEAPVKRCGGGYRLPPKLHQWHKPDLDNRPVLTAEQQAKRIEAYKKRLTKPDEMLLRKCIEGDEAGCKDAIRQGARINCADIETGQTALIKAARHNNANCVQYLLSNGADINQSDTQGWTPLFWASRMGSVACVRELMNPTNKEVKGCDFRCVSKTDSRVKDIADEKVLRTINEERVTRGLGAEGLKEDVGADDDLPGSAAAKADPGQKGKAKKAAKNYKRNVVKVRKTLMNAWGENSISPKPKMRPKSAPVDLQMTGRRGSIVFRTDQDPRGLSEAQKEKRLKRLLTDASTGIKGYINLKEQDKVSGQIRLDHKKRDLVLREGLVRDLVRSSPDPTVYSLIWKYETHNARPSNDRVIFRNWAEM